MKKAYDLSKPSDMRRFERNLKKAAENAVKDKIENDGFEIECPFCKKAISVKPGKNECKYCNSVINVEF